MIKQTLIIFTTALLIVSCKQADKATGSEELKNTMTEPLRKNNKVEIALAFMNAYINNANKMDKSINLVDYIQADSFTTNTFKSELKKIVDDAYRIDPELGPEADPIFDAQDYPDKGFELESMDEKLNYLILKGKNWPDFKVTIKVVEENGKWLVDGCGMVNIPADKRAAR